jgi:hypothetical protein
MRKWEVILSRALRSPAASLPKPDEEVGGRMDQSCPDPQSRLHLLFEPEIEHVV